MNAHGQTICLNMIVKNEAHVIRRCLASVRPFIDSWVIVDTGSTDGTQSIIREEFADLPGMLIERPWVNFAHNRTEALEAAKDRGNYAFIIDADETLSIDAGFTRPQLDADSYDIAVHFGGIAYHRKQLVRNELAWRYVGVLHEYIHCDQAVTSEFLKGVHIDVTHNGARAHDPLTYRRDALVLEKALLDEPDNVRYVFYLAQSYRDAGDPELALRHYRRRTTMGGWSDEVWYARYQIALMEERLGKPWPEIIASHLAAYQYLPERAEPLYQIAMHFQRAGDFHTARIFFMRAIEIVRPAANRLFVWEAMYDYLLELEFAVCCFYTGHHTEAVLINSRLLERDVLPENLREQVIINRRHSLKALGIAGAAAGEADEDLAINESLLLAGVAS
jgi:glycosyltransferase involved in cell wall biosynthesis